MTPYYKIIQDEYPSNPRTDFDNLGVMYCPHRRYSLGDLEALPPSVDCINLPLYLLDHSGIQISTWDFGDPWDSGQVGFIYITAQKMKEENFDPAKALECLQGEVETYNQYLTGDVWGYEIIDEGNCVESCWGFFGEKYAEEEAKDALENYIAGLVLENEETLA